MRKKAVYTYPPTRSTIQVIRFSPGKAAGKQTEAHLVLPSLFQPFPCR